MHPLPQQPNRHGMLRNRIYYRIKPLIPPNLRLSVRRWFAMRKQDSAGNVWPILPGSEQVPPNWFGWPDEKRFAVVLTHDVEGAAGVAKCADVMRLEMERGFSSSFNFVPEGRYRVPRELREELQDNGFEVGVHDLKHNGRLFRNRETFRRGARRINQYLRDWGAVGFRSGFMFHNLEWAHDLDVEYCSCTFDTDPFEPQPDGVGTIFPFWVQTPNASSKGYKAQEKSGMNEHGPSLTGLGTPKQGYVELPYTMPQDSTLFLLLNQTSIAIWKKKLDWIASHGGMVLVNTHPDYMGSCGAHHSTKYPFERYVELLDYISQEYSGDYWHALPREVASFISEQPKKPKRTVSRSDFNGCMELVCGCNP